MGTGSAFVLNDKYAGMSNILLHSSVAVAHRVWRLIRSSDCSTRRDAHALRRWHLTRLFCHALVHGRHYLTMNDDQRLLYRAQ